MIKMPFPKSIQYLSSRLNKGLVKFQLKKPKYVRKFTPEELHHQGELLYFDILPAAWNMKDKQYPFQCYSIKAASLCIELIERYGNYDFLDTIEEAGVHWFSLKQRDIAIGYKYSNPYSAFLVFLVELCVRLQKLQRKIKTKSKPERRFYRLMLMCLHKCFDSTLLKNVTHIDCSIRVLKKVADNKETKMDLLIDFFNKNPTFELNEEVAQLFKNVIESVVKKIEIYVKS